MREQQASSSPHITRSPQIISNACIQTSRNILPLPLPLPFGEIVPAKYSEARNRLLLVLVVVARNPVEFTSASSTRLFNVSIQSSSSVATRSDRSIRRREAVHLVDRRSGRSGRRCNLHGRHGPIRACSRCSLRSPSVIDRRSMWARLCPCSLCSS